MPENHQDIIERIKKGDQKAFRLIVEEYRQMAFSVAFRILCNEEEARDAVQESFIKIWQKIGTYDMTQKFSTWIYKIIVNSAIDRMRQIRKVRITDFDRALSRIDQLNLSDNLADMDNRELAALIGWLSDGLPEKQRLVFVLRDLQGVESSEVQQILNMPETSVKSNLHHARLAIRERLVKSLK
jgi:RNA polymerase sigma-70 factor, ECF subfamily